jgi:glutamine transport system substrate-binding protein
MQKIFLSFVLSVLALGLVRTVESQEKPLVVDIEITAPCVMESNSTYTGFDIELWEEIAQELELAFTYNETDLKGIFTDLVEGNADVALCTPFSTGSAATRAKTKRTSGW